LPLRQVPCPRNDLFPRHWAAILPTGNDKRLNGLVDNGASPRFQAFQLTKQKALSPERITSVVPRGEVCKE